MSAIPCFPKLVQWASLDKEGVTSFSISSKAAANGFAYGVRVTSVSPRTRRDALEWADQHSVGRMTFIPSLAGSRPLHSGTLFFFEHPNDAFEFKLRWG